MKLPVVKFIPVSVNGKVLFNNGDIPYDSTIKIKDDKGKILAHGDVNREGYYKFSKLVKGKKYRVEVSLSGYKTVTHSFTFSGSKTTLPTLKLIK